MHTFYMILLTINRTISQHGFKDGKLLRRVITVFNPFSMEKPISTIEQINRLSAKKYY